MTQKIDRTKSSAGRFTKRTIAVILSVIMLISAIATGSVLNVIAAVANSDAPDGAAVAAAGAAVRGIADDALSAQAKPGDAEPSLEKKGDADLAGTGFDAKLWFNIKGGWDSWADHWVEPNTSFEIDLTSKAAGTDVEFTINVDENGTKYWFKDGAVIYTEKNKDHIWNAGEGNNNKFHVVKPCKIKVTPTWVNDGASMKLTITSVTESSPTETKWYLIGGTSWGNWTTSNTSYPLTKNTTTGYYEKEVTLSSTQYFRVHNGTNQFNINNTDRKAVTDSFQTMTQDTASAAMALNAGSYVLQVSDDGTTRQIRAISATKYTLKVPTVDWAEVTASYGGKTATESNTLTDIPAGASVSISILPDIGKSCTAVSSTPTATISGSDHSWTLTMPADNVTNLTFTQGTVTTKKVYFNNGNTLYSMVSAYVKYSNGVEPLGPYPGKTMTKGDNSNIWSIEVPGDVNYITFIGDDGVTTNDTAKYPSNPDGMMTIPWSNTNPKYTAPYNHNDAPTETNGGTWGNYANVNRSNVYKVSDGDNMNRSNIFKGITATMYDYYVDNEVSESNNKWRSGISTTNPFDYSVGNGKNYKWNPYTKLNDALDVYARQRTVSTPLYFGNLNTTNGGTDLIKVKSGTYNGQQYYNWDYAANNSNGLPSGHTHRAVTGLTGKTLANGNIRSYNSSDTTNENGPFLAMFDDDFLSGENSQDKVLASILRSSSFPVRKTNEGGTTTYPNKIYVLCDGTDGTVNWTDDSAQIWVRFVNSSGSKISDVKMTTKEGSYYTTTIPSGSTKISLVRMPKDYSSTDNIDYNKKWNQAADIAVTTDTTSANRLYKVTSWDANTAPTRTNIDSSYGTTTGGHTYYEFDSTDGKDNAYITDIDTSAKTAKIAYYADSDDKKVHAADINDQTDTNGTVGFFPFDGERAGSGKGGLAHDLGFGMKLEIPFTLGLNGKNEDNTAQTFDFSGDDDLWVFIDGQLILDLGGAHLKSSGSINFNTKTVTVTDTQKATNASGATRNAGFTINTSESGVNTVHTMTIYYMERGMYDSNLKFGFSFHAVPELLQVDKKVRTANINSGFFIVNSTTGATDGSGNPVKNDKDKQITKFEYTYQADKALEPFTITNTGTPKNSSVNYTIGSNSYTQTPGTSFNYTLYNDQVAYFSEQYTPGTSVTLKETIPTNSKYHYDQSFSLVDLAHNEEAYAYTTNADGYTFTPPTPSGTGLDDIRLRARFTNQMKSHDLYLTKEVNDDNEDGEEFTLNVQFKFGDYDYMPYPVYCTVDGVKNQLTDAGNITITPGQVVRLTNIPENALVKITEAAETDDSKYIYKDVALSSTGLNKANIDHGITFTVGTGDVYATVQNVKYRYSFTYQYPAYVEDYGNQSYTIEDVITKADMGTYFTLSGNSLTFKNDTAKESFLNSKAPYENNFMDDLTLDTSVAQTEYDSTNYIIKTTATNPAEFKKNPSKLSVSIKLPYDVSGLTPVESDGKVYYKNNPVNDLGKNYNFLDWLTTSGGVNPNTISDGADPGFVTAPLVLYNSSDATKAYLFDYWSVKSAGNAINRTQVEYTRCYSKEFNYVIFQDIILEAKYHVIEASQIDAVQRAYDPVARQTAGNDGVTITFIENSRNQYNNFGAGTLSSKKTRNIAGDRMYSDFLLSFNNSLGSTEVMNERTDDTKCGVIIQAVGSLTFNGSGYNTNLSDYSMLDSLDTDSALKNDLVNFINTTAKSTTISGNTTAKSEFDVSKLDNKNRIEFYYGLVNKRDNTLDETDNAKKLYRAFAYIKDGTTGDVKISDKPAYFTIFDMANIKVWGGNN